VGEWSRDPGDKESNARSKGLRVRIHPENIGSEVSSHMLIVSAQMKSALKE